MVACSGLAALAAVSGTANAQGGFGPQELTTVQVTENIYMIRSGASGNVTVLLSDDGVLLIDDRFAQDHCRHHGEARRDHEPARAARHQHARVIPGHSGPTDRAMLEGYLAETVRLQDRVRQMNRQGRSRDEIQSMLESEFGWSGFMMNFGLDGIISEMQ